ncbi:MAG TPA: dethiobiotin synthase [Pirellulaceae bacterium]|nr:dethiobiotin synthase [Pirellulaceae bacterium]HMP69392.1 dethiobiotin synthase [Pirellulaceae bacterium]
MINKPPVGLFVTGTNTEVGKTYVASMIVRSLMNAGHRVGVYKPVATDCMLMGDELVASDAIVLWEAAGRPLTLDRVCPQRFHAALAPHLAAKSEAKVIESDMLRTGIEAWYGECDIIVVEGVGGLLSPIGEDEYVADLAYEFGYPLVIVAANVLGAINQTLQTLVAAACFRDGLPVAGIVLNDLQGMMNDQSVDLNESEISARAMVPILARVGFEATNFSKEVDWFEIAQRKTV